MRNNIASVVESIEKASQVSTSVTYPPIIVELRPCNSIASADCIDNQNVHSIGLRYCFKSSHCQIDGGFPTYETKYSRSLVTLTLSRPQPKLKATHLVECLVNR